MSEWDDREDAIRRAAGKKGWRLWSVRARSNSDMAGAYYRLVADDGLTVLGKGSRGSNVPARYAMTLEQAEDALKYIECEVLRCGAPVGGILASMGSGRRIEVPVCEAHSVALDTENEGAAWVLSYQGGRYIVLTGEDIQIQRGS